MAGKKTGATAEAPAPTGTNEGTTAVLDGTENTASEQGSNANEETVTALVVPKSAGAVVSLEDVQGLMVDDAEQDLGFEKGDVAIPFLRILQSNSPQVKRQNAKYVEDAEAGMFFNSATNRVYSGMDGLFVVPVVFQRQATLWLPRGEGATGGGFVAEIPMHVAEELLKSCTKTDKGKDLTPPFTGEQIASMNDGGRVPNGFDKGPQQCELVISAMYYVLIVDPEIGSAEPAAFPLTSTQLKKSRTWNALINNARLPNPGGVGAFRPAMFAFSYKLTTVPESNNKGDWMGVRIMQHLPLIKYEGGKPVEKFPNGAQTYLAARDFKDLIGKGKVKVKQDDVTDDGGTMGDDDEDGPTPF